MAEAGDRASSISRRAALNAGSATTLLASLLGASTAAHAAAEATATVESVAALRALRGGAVGRVTLGGYHADGDAGRGDFYWAAGDTAADNGGTVIAPDAGGVGRWRRLLPFGIVDVRHFGATGSGSGDDRPAIEAAIAAVPQSGGTVFFPPGTYRIGRYISCLRSNIALVGGPGVVIHNVHPSAGYERDGLRVGEPDAADAEEGRNASPTVTYVENIVVDGFRFAGCRAGLRVVRARNISIAHIWADGVAAVAVGNDATDDCRNVHIRHVFMTGWTIAPSGEEWYIVGLFRTTDFSVDGVYQTAGMTVTPNASALTIANCERGTAVNIHLDQATRFADGITVTNSTDVVVSEFTVANAKNGVVDFPGSPAKTHNGIFANGVLRSCTAGIRIYALRSTYRGLRTAACATDLYLMTDAYGNLFDGCAFNDGGAAVVREEIPGGNNGINLQRWRGCVGVPYGDSDGYLGNRVSAFRARARAGAADVTGDGTAHVMTWGSKDYDRNGDFDAATGTFTAPIQGVYHFDGAVGVVDAEAAGYAWVDLFLRVNLTDHPICRQVTTSNTQVAGGFDTVLLRGDRVRLVVAVGGGSKKAGIGADAARSYFSGHLVG